MIGLECFVRLLAREEPVHPRTLGMERRVNSMSSGECGGPSEPSPCVRSQTDHLDWIPQSRPWRFDPFDEVGLPAVAEWTRTRRPKPVNQAARPEGALRLPCLCQ